MGWFSKLMQRDQKPVVRRSFKGASAGNLVASWINAPVNLNNELKQGLPALRARSRDLARNNPYGKKFVTMAKANIVGQDGIVLQAKAKNQDGTLDTVDNATIEMHWKRWGRKPEITGRVSWVDLQNVVVETIARDGEVFIHHREGTADNAYRYSIQVIDPELIDHTYNLDAPDRRIRMGVEVDFHGKPLAYHVIQGISDVDRNQKKRVRIPADEVTHHYIVEEIDQLRGIPWMTAGMYGLKMLDGYQEAEVVAARLGASSMGFFKRSDPSVSWDGETDEDGNFIEDADPGTFRILPDGYDLASYDPNHPAGNYAPFVKACMRSVSSGFGVSYNSLANDLEGVNFSSIRAGVLEDREIWKGLQRWLTESFHSEVYERWLRNALLTNELPLPASRLEKFREVTWQPRRWAWVDPKKDIEANIMAVNEGLKSRGDCIRESGRDPEDVWAEIARENERLAELGVTVGDSIDLGMLSDEGE